MGDYIRREDAVDAVKHAWAKGVEPSQYIESLEPAADVVPVVHARWVNYSPITIKCSRCGHVIHDWRYSECRYCPNCGAKMDGKREE